MPIHGGGKRREKGRGKEEREKVEGEGGGRRWREKEEGEGGGRRWREKV